MLSLRLRTLGAALLTALVAACVLAAPAGAAATKPYSVVISPSTLVPTGVPVSYKATITNLTRNQTLGSAELTVPFQQITNVAVSGGTAILSGNIVQLRNLGVAFGKSVTATLTATAPSSNPCAVASFTWGVAAKQSNDFNGTGNDFGPLAPDSILTTTTSCAGTTTTPCAAPCLGTLTDTDASISVSIPDSIGLVTITRGTGLDCAGYDEILGRDFTVGFLPNPGTVGGTKTVTIDITKAAMQASTNNGLSQVNVCFEAPFTFDAKLGLEPRPPAQGPFRGLLLDCGAAVPGESPTRLAGPPCVFSRQSVGGGARIVVNAPGGDQDPRYGP